MKDASSLRPRSYDIVGNIAIIRDRSVPRETQEAAADEILSSNRHLKVKLPRILTREHVAKIAEATEHPRDRALVLFMWETDWHISEILSLKAVMERDNQEREAHELMDMLIQDPRMQILREKAEREAERKNSKFSLAD